MALVKIYSINTEKVSCLLVSDYKIRKITNAYHISLNFIFYNEHKVQSSGDCEVIVKCCIDMITIILVTSPLNQS